MQVCMQQYISFLFCFFFLIFFCKHFRRGAVGLRVATTPWYRINPYIRLNPSPRNFRRSSAGGLTRDRPFLVFFFISRGVYHLQISLAAPRQRILLAMLAETRLFILSVVALQVSWLVSVPRGKISVHSRDRGSIDIHCDVTIVLMYNNRIRNCIGRASCCCSMLETCYFDII